MLIVISTVFTGSGLAGTAQAQAERGAIPSVSLDSNEPGQLVITRQTPDPAPTDYRINWAHSSLGFLSYRDSNEAQRGNAYPSGNENTLTLDGLTPGEIYKVQLRARYYTANRSAHEWSGPWTGTSTTRVMDEPAKPPPPEETPQPAEQTESDDPPAAPTGLTVARVGHSVLTLSWNDPQDERITGYRVLRGASVDSLSTIEENTGGVGTEYADDTVAPETTYHYAVIALSAVGDGAQSDAVSATTTAAPKPKKQPTPESARQTVTTLLSNIGQTSDDASISVRATAFTTGTGTYTLSSVGIFIGSQSGFPTPVVQIYGDTGGNPGTLVATMTNPGTFADNAVNTFTAPANTTLSASTTYWVVTSNSAATNGQGFRVRTNPNTTLDSGAAAGWSIGAARFKSDIAATSWNSSTSNRILFEIRGTGGTTTNNPPTVANAIPDQSATAGTAFSYAFPDTTFTDADTGDTLSYTATKADDTALPLWLAFAASTRTFSGTPTDAGTVAVKVTASDGNGGSVSDTFDITVAADTTPPTLTSAGVNEAGLFILLGFSENLQLSNLPPASAFTVTAGGSAVTVGGVLPRPGAPDVFVITVSPAIRQGQAIVVTYTDPTAGDDATAFQDVAGNDAASFTTGSDGVPAVTNASTVVPATTATEVPAGWNLKPTSLTTGDKFRLLFLSSTKRDGSSTDIAVYNTFVQGLAAAGHADIRAYSAGFRAVGCTAAVDARDNTKTTYTATDKGVPIYWLDGAKAADEYEDFYDGDWDDEANDKNESGTDGPDTSQLANYPLTGCDHDGTEAFFNTSSRALGVTQGNVRVSRPNSSVTGHGPIGSDNGVGPASTHPMYGLSGVFQVAAAMVINTPATGAPAITGAAQVGQTLTAGTTAIMDANGLNSVNYMYQWIRVATDNTETNIASATASTYTLVDADLGTTIKVKVSFTDDASNAETLTSAATAAVAAAAAPTEVPAGWNLKPTSLTTGDKFRLLFLSSTKRDGSSTDIAVYNTFVQGLAAAGHADIRAYSAGFRAVGCTAAVDARDNTKTTYTATDKGVPIYWLNGAKAADQYEDFYDGSWDDEANDKNESGTNGPDTSQAVNRPYTGCNHDGIEAFSGVISLALGTSGTFGVRIGLPNSPVINTGPIGSEFGVVPSSTRPMYGLSAVFQVAAAVVTNNPPTVANTIPDQSATAGTAFSYAFPANTFSDADTGDTLSYTATKADDTALPTWLSFAASTRTFSGTPTDAGMVALKVTASDGNGGSVSDTFDITVAADTTPPTLISATVVPNGSIMRFQFSETLDVSNLPPVSAFTVTAGGNTITNGSPMQVPGSRDGVALSFSPVILQGQAVVVTYTDPTAGDDANAIQDTAGNDAATFTTGMDGVPAVTNNSTVTNTPATGAPTITGTAQVGQTLTAGHHRHHGCQRADQRQLRVPVDPGGHRQHRDEHRLGDGEHLHAGGGRPGHDGQGEGELHRRRQHRRDADQRGDGGRHGGAEHPSLGV